MISEIQDSSQNRLYHIVFSAAEQAPREEFVVEYQNVFWENCCLFLLFVFFFVGCIIIGLFVSNSI